MAVVMQKAFPVGKYIAAGFAGDVDQVLARIVDVVTTLQAEPGNMAANAFLILGIVFVRIESGLYLGLRLHVRLQALESLAVRRLLPR